MGQVDQERAHACAVCNKYSQIDCVLRTYNIDDARKKTFIF